MGNVSTVVVVIAFSPSKNRLDLGPARPPKDYPVIPPESHREIGVVEMFACSPFPFPANEYGAPRRDIEFPLRSIYFSRLTIRTGRIRFVDMQRLFDVIEAQGYEVQLRIQ